MKIEQVIIVDDHKIFRDGLRLLLNEIPNIKVVAEASNGKQFLELLDTHHPDIVFMDIKMPEMNGIDATQQALLKYPGIKIIILSMSGNEEHFSLSLNVGACAYLLKNSDVAEIEKAINAVLEGNNFFSEALLKDLVRKNYIMSRDKIMPVENPDNLSSRELEVLQLLCRGFSNHEIAKELNISPRTVDGHRANILDKTHSKNSISLAVYAIKKGLVDISDIQTSSDSIN
jgi:DNA-binding NarL/FixJ family response regulator